MRETRYYVTISAEERRLALDAMIRFHNKTISQGVDTVDIDRLIRKLQGRKVWWF